MNYLAPVGIGILLIVAVIAIVFNPTLSGVLFALIVLVGAACVWLMWRTYLAESERHDD